MPRDRSLPHVIDGGKVPDPLSAWREERNVATFCAWNRKGLQAIHRSVIELRRLRLFENAGVDQILAVRREGEGAPTGGWGSQRHARREGHGERVPRWGHVGS